MRDKYFLDSGKMTHGEAVYNAIEKLFYELIRDLLISGADEPFLVLSDSDCDPLEYYCFNTNAPFITTYRKDGHESRFRGMRVFETRGPSMLLRREPLRNEGRNFDYITPNLGRWFPIYIDEDDCKMVSKS